MKYANKYILVPFTKNIETDPISKDIQDLDNQMRNILNNTKLLADEKIKLYNDLLQKYTIQSKKQEDSKSFIQNELSDIKTSLNQIRVNTDENETDNKYTHITPKESNMEKIKNELDTTKLYKELKNKIEKPKMHKIKKIKFFRQDLNDESDYVNNDDEFDQLNNDQPNYDQPNQPNNDNESDQLKRINLHKTINKLNRKRKNLEKSINQRTIKKLKNTLDKSVIEERTKRKNELQKLQNSFINQMDVDDENTMNTRNKEYASWRKNEYFKD